MKTKGHKKKKNIYFGNLHLAITRLGEEDGLKRGSNNG